MKAIPMTGPAFGEGCCPSLEKFLEPSFFKALCDPIRAAILGRLAELGKPGTVSEIAACCPRDISVVSRHLATLRDAGIVIAERKGKEVHYRIQAARVAGMLHRLADALEQCCTPEGEERKS